VVQEGDGWSVFIPGLPVAAGRVTASAIWPAALEGEPEERPQLISFGRWSRRCAPSNLPVGDAHHDGGVKQQGRA
jgi:hypothetical protein